MGIYFVLLCGENNSGTVANDNIVKIEGRLVIIRINECIVKMYG